MRIKKLELNENDVKKYGLEKFQTSKLNSVVALVGKNGSGKTRYLDAIQNKIRTTSLNDIFFDRINYLSESIINSINSTSSHTSLLKKHAEINEIQDRLNLDPENKTLTKLLSKLKRAYGLEIRNTRNQNIQVVYNQIEKRIQTEILKRIKIINASDIRALKDSIENNNIKNPTFQDIVDSTNDIIEVDELSMINSSALTFLHGLPHKLAYDELQTKGDIKKFKSRASYKRFLILKNLVLEFLDKELEWKSNTSQFEQTPDGVVSKTSGYWTIQGRIFNYNDFSDGEKVLFIYALLLFLLSINPRTKFEESIIFIDEPEINLHPKAQIKLIETISNLIKDKGQLFIATHSLTIIANLDYSSIHLVRNNKLMSPCSSNPYNSVDDLMGFDEHYNKIVEFLASTPSWAMTNFMAECFKSPDVFEFASMKDPQIDLINNMLLEKSEINILDFGSGKGRLLEQLQDSETWNRIIDYDCFDINEKYNESVQSKGAQNVYNELNEIPNEKYDFAVVVNVLHEISIEYWISSINKLKNSLKPNGFLIIIEDIELPIGELPNDHGFLLLGKEELKNLMGGNVSFLKPTNSRYADRIICCLVQKEEIAHLSQNTLISTLEILKNNSLIDIVSYRKIDNREAKHGRLYALKANSYVNSELAMKRLLYENNSIRLRRRTV